MAHNQTNNTHAGFVEKEEIGYRTKKWFIFSWQVINRVSSLGKDLHITTCGEKYERIFVDGKEIEKQK